MVEPAKKPIRWFENAHYYSAVASLLDVVPIIPYKQLPFLVGRWPVERELSAVTYGLAEVVKVVDKRWGWRLDTLRRYDVSPRRVWKFRPVGFYQSFCWNPRLSIGVLASQAEVGDWLLLGSDVEGWASVFAPEASIPRHWSYRAGGIGAGFLVTHRGGASQRWTFMIDRAGKGAKRGGVRTPYEVGLGLAQEIGPLVSAARAGGLLPELHFIWTTQQFDLRKVSHSFWKRQISEFDRAFREASRYAGGHGGMVIEGGAIRVSHGLMFGAASPGEFRVAEWAPGVVQKWVEKPLKTGHLFNVHQNKSATGGVLL